ncbi:MAG TPA: hypothetical protein VIU46_00895 [Gallionellaceae bacterium]
MRAWIAPRAGKWGARPFAAASWCVFDEDERKAYGARFLQKDADGYCRHLNREDYRCEIWDTRSRTCRSYSCNGDFLLQVAVRNPIKNIAELVKMAATAYIPKETYISIPPAEES